MIFEGNKIIYGYQNNYIRIKANETISSKEIHQIMS